MSWDNLSGKKRRDTFLAGTLVCCSKQKRLRREKRAKEMKGLRTEFIGKEFGWLSQPYYSVARETV